MATKLKNMRLTSVDLVRAGANQEADICLYKSATPPEATESPTSHETNIFKRFIAWLRENPTETQDESQNPIEKADEPADLETIYKTALAESIRSIYEDPNLTSTERLSMVEKSVDQYTEKMKEIPEEEEFEEEEEIELSADDPDRFDEIEEVHKYNHNHGADGKFTTSRGGGGASPASNAMNRFIQTSSKPVHVWSPSGKMTTVSGGRQDGKVGHDGALGGKPKEVTYHTTRAKKPTQSSKPSLGIRDGGEKQDYTRATAGRKPNFDTGAKIRRGN